MMQIISDPEAIQFTKGNTISLPLLKNQIDRRILKITCMVKKLTKKRRRSHDATQKHPKVNKHVQTEYQQPQECKQVSMNILRSINQNERLNRQMELNPIQTKKQNKQNQSLKKMKAKQTTSKKSIIQGQKQQKKSQQNDLIESNGFTFREVQPINEGSTDRKLIQDSQDDKFFQNMDFRMEISNVQMCQSITNQRDVSHSFTTLPSKQPCKASDILMVSSFTDLSGSDLGRNEGQSRRGNKKIKFGGKQVILPEPKRRIIVSEQCKLKIEREVQQTYNKKRKQVCDYKVRFNVLKKIEQKYGEQYSI